MNFLVLNYFIVGRVCGWGVLGCSFFDFFIRVAFLAGLSDFSLAFRVFLPWKLNVATSVLRFLLCQAGAGSIETASAILNDTIHIAKQGRQ